MTPDENPQTRETRIHIDGDVGPGSAVGEGAHVDAKNIAGRDVNIFYGLINRWGMPLLLLITVVVVVTLLLVALDGQADQPQSTVAFNSLVSPTQRPTATTPAPSPTPLPELQVLTDPVLKGHVLHDVSADGGHVWFAAGDGLLHFDAATGAVQPIAAVREAVETVLAAPNGPSVWFSLQTGAVGRYHLVDERVDRFEKPPEASLATALALLPDGALWLGDLNGRLWQIPVGAPPNSIWQPIEIPDALPPVTSVYALAVAPTSLPAIWVIGADAGYRWQAGTWESFDSTDGFPLVINAVAADTNGRVWFGHSAGLTLFRRAVGEQTIRTCPVDAAGLSNVVLDLATTADDAALWVVTRAELARLAIDPEQESGGCAEPSNWQHWREFGFWRGTTASQYRLAIDVNTADKLTIWVIRRDSDQVRRLNWR